ncbi:hypothetical protein SAMN02799630_02859 [Paenibacillus sp. UNCCL117]|uniref:hypothetical protein n=1 Tax=unclassified Paenibacillus TaxID=185978 RepID=UPI000887B075|nr:MULTISPECIES: hypothetical protein [unclassified Paenibacillus]SDD27724.1 hypothetical protein SAMN04488602_107132 [Paenibacillus sp. cl123]SFW41035.1 hypothetical protein SAMN02799630_02859 [Paenibacillus sp. UNCCL117]
MGRPRKKNYIIAGPPDSVKKFRLSKEQYLLERIAGKSRQRIADEQGISFNTLYNRHLVKWGIRAMNLEEAAMQLLGKSTGIGGNNCENSSRG